MTENNVKYIKLEEETGEFLISSYGKGIALGFKGDYDFIRRCQNLVRNFGLSKRTKLSSLGLGSIYYVCTTAENLTKALTDYYRAQVIINNLVEPFTYEHVEDIKLPIRDECAVESKAAELVQSFMDKVSRINFMYGIDKVGLAEYRTAA